MRGSRLSVLAALVGALVLARPGITEASSNFLVVPEAEVAERTPAYRYANMTDAEAFSELERRKVLFTRLGAVDGVRAPIRLTGRLHGVWFHSSLPPEQRVNSSFEILDARLALALGDFAAILERHDIDEVMHFTMYRPGGAAPDGVHDQDEHTAAPAPRAKAGKRARSRPARSLETKDAVREKGKPAARGGSKRRGSPPKSRSPLARRVAPSAREERGGDAPVQRSTYAPAGTRHPAGLAIDVGGLRKKDGRWISVGKHFLGTLGDRTCGGVTLPDSPDARELRSIVCEAADLGVFTYVLTPNYNAAHADHFHMEIKHGVRWFLYH